MKYKGIKDLKVGDTCYVFTGNKINVGKVIDVRYKYSTWFKKSCLFIKYSYNGIEDESEYPDEQLTVSWVGGPLIADLNEAKKHADKCNIQDLNKLKNKYVKIKQKYDKELKDIVKNISDLNKIIEHNNKLL